MVRYILSFFISLTIYIGLIYTLCIYFNNRLKSIKQESKREMRIKISLLEEPKRVIKPKPSIKPTIKPILFTPPPVILTPKPTPKPILKHRKYKKKIVKRDKKIIHKKRHIAKPKIVKSKKSVIKPRIVKIIPTVTPEPIIEEVYREIEEIVTPPPKKRVERVVKRVATHQHIKPIQRENSNLTIQKRKFLNRVRRNIYSNRIYPIKAKRRGIEGRVHLIFDITSSGEVTNIRTSNAPRILQKSVKKALKQSFPIDIPPILLDKFPMRNISIDIEFKLE